MKTLGRNQLMLAVGSVLVIGAGALGVSLMGTEAAKMFLDFLDSFGRWTLTLLLGGSAAIKTAGAVAGVFKK